MRLGNQDFLVLEYLAGGDLNQFVKRQKDTKNFPSFYNGTRKYFQSNHWEWIERPSFSHNLHFETQDLIVNVMLQLVDAVEYLHKNQIFHRDIKPDNVFFTKDMDAKLGDLGLSVKKEMNDETEIEVKEQLTDLQGIESS